MSKVTDLNSFFHHLVNTAKLETEAEWRLAHDLIDIHFTVEATTPPLEATTPPLDKTTTKVKKTTNFVGETAPTSVEEVIPSE